jgi:histone-arginine methyltransferase CARM1
LNDSDARDDSGLVRVLPGWRALHSIHYQFLDNQQNMLEDETRTGAYYRGITHNRADFEGRTVLDVGAGTGILSLFAAQAGARKVYAVESTESSEFARQLAEHNGLENRIEIVRTDLTDLVLPEKVDVVISEPWGFFLFHERMVETFLFARDRFLKPGGKLFPSTGRIWMAPFTDHSLYEARLKCGEFWHNKDFFGVDLSGLAETAEDRLFEMPIVGYIAPHLMMASPVSHAFDFRSMPLASLAKIALPFSFTASHPGAIHGIAGWFDVSFDGSQEQVRLTTAPDTPKTHWMQIRFVFKEPIAVHIGQTLQGSITLVANEQSSYTAHLEARFEDHPVRLQKYNLHAHFWWGNA